jgi:hypothetical protein
VQPALQDVKLLQHVLLLLARGKGFADAVGRR